MTLKRTPERGPGDRLAQARRMKAVRDWRDVTRADVARAVGVDNSTISVWEGGKLPGDDRLAEVCEYLGVSPAWVRYNVEPSVAPPDHEVGAHEYLAATKKAAPHKAARKRRA